MTDKSIHGRLKDLVHTLDAALDELDATAGLCSQYRLPAPYIATLKAAGKDLEAVSTTVNEIAKSLQPPPADSQL